MSTYQPPGGPQSEGTPYAQPQDPWSGAEPGVASVPTDPIPQQYDPYQSTLTPSQIWSQQTVVHGSQYGYGQQPGRGKLIALVVTLLVVLGGAGGFAAWYIVTHGQPDPGQTTAGPSDGPTSPGSESPIQQFPTTCKISSDEAAFDPCAVKEGDCLFNDGTPAAPDIRVIDCGVENSYKVLKVGRGPDIKEGKDDVFDKDTTSVAECKDTGYQHWYGYQDAFDDNKDVFLCLASNP